jgi:hypothetical protein
MKRPVAVLLGISLFLIGCASSGEQPTWDDFSKDLRGDNMKMHGWSQMQSNEDRPEALKAYD